MTRINLIPVECLSDKHLIAEYKEITRPFGKVKARLEKEKSFDDIPKSFTLNKGHETFSLINFFFFITGMECYSMKWLNEK